MYVQVLCSTSMCTYILVSDCAGNMGNNLTGVAVQFATQDQKNATSVQKCTAIFNIKICYYVVFFIQISSKLEFLAMQNFQSKLFPVTAGTLFHCPMNDRKLVTMITASTGSHGHQMHRWSSRALELSLGLPVTSSHGPQWSFCHIP